MFFSRRPVWPKSIGMACFVKRDSTNIGGPSSTRHSEIPPRIHRGINGTPNQARERRGPQAGELGRSAKRGGRRMFSFFRRLLKAEPDRPAVIETGPESKAQVAMIRAC